jgi:GT2 family glycosyltransferase
MKLDSMISTSDGEHFPKSPPKAGIVTVNWNGWSDTLECLEAVFKLKGFQGPVVVVDNGSTDGSVDFIAAWARGELSIFPKSKHPQIESLVLPPVAKPIPFKLLESSSLNDAGYLDTACRLFVVCTGQNLGFAGANNLGMSLLLQLADIELLWLVNNDALPRGDALEELTAAADLQGLPQIYGSALLEYSDPLTIQAVGGKYSPYSGRSKHVLAGQPITCLDRLGDRIAVDYPAGAAMVVNRSFIKEHGLMSEDYFLYCEEIDWVLRTRPPKKAFAVPRSVVFHKGGASTAADWKGVDRGLTADYYTLRNRLLLARQVSLWAFFCCAILMPVTVVRRVFRPRRGTVSNAFQAIRDGLLGRTGKRSG